MPACVGVPLNKKLVEETKFLLKFAVFELSAFQNWSKRWGQATVAFITCQKWVEMGPHLKYKTFTCKQQPRGQIGQKHGVKI